MCWAPFLSLVYFSFHVTLAFLPNHISSLLDHLKLLSLDLTNILFPLSMFFCDELKNGVSKDNYVSITGTYEFYAVCKKHLCRCDSVRILELEIIFYYLSRL